MRAEVDVADESVRVGERRWRFALDCRRNIVAIELGADSGAVADIARRAAATGAKVEVLGVVPGDATWDDALFELSQAMAESANK